MSGEVRLWHIEPLGEDGWCAWEPSDNWLPDTTAYIALPAAEFEAWGRVVGCARVLRGAEAMGDRQARGGALVALIAAVDALPPEAQQPGRAGGGA